MINPLEVRAACADLSNALQRLGTFDGTGAVEEYLKAVGWSLLGAGCFSAAYGKGGLVIKVNRREDGSDAYMLWCMLNRGLPVVPDVYRVERYKGGYCAIMQRYSVIRWNSPTASEERAMDTLSKVLHGYGEPDKADPAYDTALLIREAFPEAGYDLHWGNVMNGPHGLVLTDPFCRSSRRAEDVVQACSSRKERTSSNTGPVYAGQAGIVVTVDLPAWPKPQVNKQQAHEAMLAMDLRAVKERVHMKPHMHIIAKQERNKMRPGRHI